MRQTLQRREADLIFRPTSAGTDGQDAARSPPGPVSQAWFDAPLCRNCGADLTTPYCAQCGQKAARRFAWRDLGREGWERLRLFELRFAKTLRRLVFSPGTVAREYVLGRRDAHMHPLKLLVALVAILVLLLATNRYFENFAYSGASSDVDRMAQQVMLYANWSFSLGIVAIFIGSVSVFRRRYGFNTIEHAVLAIYCQNIILAFIIVNLLPTLIWRDPAFILWHKTASQYYLYAVKLLVVGAAYKQFFRLDWRSDWPKLISACLIYAALSWVLLRIYALAILWLVTRPG